MRETRWWKLGDRMVLGGSGDPWNDLMWRMTLSAKDTEWPRLSRAGMHVGRSREMLTLALDRYRQSAQLMVEVGNSPIPTDDESGWKHLADVSEAALAVTLDVATFHQRVKPLLDDVTVFLVRVLRRNTLRGVGEGINSFAKDAAAKKAHLPGMQRLLDAKAALDPAIEYRDKVVEHGTGRGIGAPAVSWSADGAAVFHQPIGTPEQIEEHMERGWPVPTSGDLEGVGRLVDEFMDAAAAFLEANLTPEDLGQGPQGSPGAETDPP